MSAALQFRRVLFRSAAHLSFPEILDRRLRHRRRAVFVRDPAARGGAPRSRSEERRVGKEGRCRRPCSSDVCSSDLLRPYPSLKFWIAGCATGEELYSFAILLREEGLLD